MDEHPRGIPVWPGSAVAEVQRHQVSVFETESSRRWVVRCVCGFGAARPDGRPTVTRATELEAVKTARWHLRKTVRDAEAEVRRNGGVSA